MISCILYSNWSPQYYAAVIARCREQIEMGLSVKNHNDMLIFHTAICAGAPQIALMADEKPPSRLSRRPVANAPEWRLKWILLQN